MTEWNLSFANNVSVCLLQFFFCSEKIYPLKSSLFVLHYRKIIICRNAKTIQNWWTQTIEKTSWFKRRKYLWILPGDWDNFIKDTDCKHPVTSIFSGVWHPVWLRTNNSIYRIICLRREFKFSGKTLQHWFR